YRKGEAFAKAVIIRFASLNVHASPVLTQGIFANAAFEYNVFDNAALSINTKHSQTITLGVQAPLWEKRRVDVCETRARRRTLFAFAHPLAMDFHRRTFSRRRAEYRGYAHDN